MNKRRKNKLVCGGLLLLVGGLLLDCCLAFGAGSTSPISDRPSRSTDCWGGLARNMISNWKFWVMSIDPRWLRGYRFYIMSQDSCPKGHRVLNPQLEHPNRQLNIHVHILFPYFFQAKASHFMEGRIPCGIFSA